MAAYIKREVEKEVGGTWHCFVGRKFSSYVTHEQGYFIYFYVGQIGICLFKVAIPYERNRTRANKKYQTSCFSNFFETRENFKCGNVCKIANVGFAS